jgi:hypothetical protein
VFPLGHATFGYLLYVPFGVATSYRLPHGATLVALLVGTQFPDVVDKPLAFLGVLPSGRSLAHSAFFAVALLAVLLVVVHRSDRGDLAVAFGFGHVSHLLGDLVPLFTEGRVGDTTFLLWPLVPATEYASDDVAPWIRVARYYASPEFGPEVLFIALAAVTFVVLEIRHLWTRAAK